MSIDYYNVLKVSRTISDENLKRAYKRLAMRWHPDKNPANKQEAEAKFKQISEAYDVLGDPHKRRIYDLYGEEVLRVGGDAFYSGADSRNAEDIFSQCFDESEPSEQTGLNSNGFNDQSRARSPVKAPPVEHKLLCSLEELYMGCKKKMKITRIIYSNGKEETLEETLTITVKPGWKRGTKVTFPEKGNQLPDMIPADVVFVIDEKPHPIFRRNGDDLLVKQRISLIEALTGKILCLKQLDGRVVTIPLTNVIKPGHELLVRGEGMPIAKERGSKGNLRMKFSVEFPTSLTEEQISGLRRIFKYQ